MDELWRTYGWQSVMSERERERERGLQVNASWLSQVSHINKSRQWERDVHVSWSWISRTSERVVNESCRTYQWVVSCTSMCHVGERDVHVDDSWMSHGAHVKDTLEQVIAAEIQEWQQNILMCLAVFATWLMHMFAMIIHIYIYIYVCVTAKSDSDEWQLNILMIMSNIRASHVAYMNESCHTYQW